MQYVYFDAASGLSGNMILGALLDLGVSPEIFREKIKELNLPVKILIQEVKRASIRGLHINVKVDTKKHHTRKWKDIHTLIQDSPFSNKVKEDTLLIFKNLFNAEAKVHGHVFEETHLHEAGADDAIVDILGTRFLAEQLGIEEFYFSPLNLGRGWVKTSHGVLPVPPPAVTELVKNVPVYSAHVDEELVTPTGAAIAVTLAKKFITFPEIQYEKIGCGAGSKNFPGFPNILRAFYGKKRHFRSQKTIFQIEANIDDNNPQILAHFLQSALRLGAVDAYLTPIIMKKNRLATKLTVLAEIDKMDTLIKAVFTETSSIGIRYFPTERRVLERTVQRISLCGGTVRIKTAAFEDQEINIQPEFDDCVKLSKKTQLPVKKIYEMALREFHRQRETAGTITNFGKSSKHTKKDLK